ncbi:MAG: hypothetical protein ABI456_18795, partial [Ktedonobacteraceae bacterium]
MVQIPISRCDCCGLAVDPGGGEDCPRCKYPVRLPKEERFLAASIHDLQRVVAYGGANLTVAGLLARYQARLHALRQLAVTSSPMPVVSQPQPVQSTPPASEMIVMDTQGSAPAAVPVALPVPVLASETPGTAEMAASTPPPPSGPRESLPRSIFSWGSDQAITIVGLLGAFLILLGALSFVYSSATGPQPDLLGAFLIAFCTHAAFGVLGLIAYRFPMFRLVARIYTVIYALLLPLAGFTAYKLVVDQSIHLSVPALIAIAAIYATVVYGLLAIYLRSQSFGYLSVVALAVTDLAIAQVFGLAFWWWPAILMLLALAALVVVPQPASNTPSRLRQLFTGPLMVLRDPVRVLMFVIVGATILSIGLGIGLNFLYSLYLSASIIGSEVRFAGAFTMLAVLIWTYLFLWLTQRKQAVVAYQFLACMLAFCYAFRLEQSGYVLALTGVALLYHSLSRFAFRLVQASGIPALLLDQLALLLVAIVPFIATSLSLLPLQLLTFNITGTLPTELAFFVDWRVIAELCSICLSCVLTLSIALGRGHVRSAAGTRPNRWPWLLLLSAFLLNWAYAMLVLSIGATPVWCFLGLALLLVASAVIMRRSHGAYWADPIDAIALVEMAFTLLLSLSPNLDRSAAFTLFFALLSYGVLLYQRRHRPLFLPFGFALLALPILLLANHLQGVLLAGVLLPLAAVAIHHLFSVRSPVSDSSIAIPPKLAVIWEWPLLVFGLLCGALVSYYDVTFSTSIVHTWLDLALPAALEIAAFALVWYAASALARVKWWLLPVVAFAAGALLIPSNPFWVLAWVTPIIALLGLGVSRITGRDEGWEFPLYVVALLGAVVTGITGFAQQQLPAATWVLLALALLAYIIGLVEDWTPGLWLAPVFATWSVIYSGLQHDVYRLPLIVLICAIVGVLIRLLDRVIPRLQVVSQRKGGLLSYALPFYATALAAAVVTGFFGTLSNVNYPFFAAIPSILLLYALLANGVALFERRPAWLWLVAGLAVWGILAAVLTTAYYVAGVGLGAGLLGLLAGRVIQRPLGKRVPLAPTWQWFAVFSWSWPWYMVALLAALLSGLWSATAPVQPFSHFSVYALSMFAVLAVVIMLVEGIPEVVILPVALAAWAIGYASLAREPLVLAYSGLCILTFASQFVWQVRSPQTHWLPAARLHRVLGLGGQALVVLVVILLGGLSAAAQPLVHIGAGTLLVLALLVAWQGRLQPAALTGRWWYYTAGLLAAFVVSWECLAFHLTGASILTLAPASYLIVLAPFLMRAESSPLDRQIGQAASILGAGLLLLPTLWLSFSDDNLPPTLLLVSEALALLFLGMVIRVRV